MTSQKKINSFILAAVSLTLIICSAHFADLQAQTAQNYLTFSTPDELSQFMKFDSGSGPLISATGVVRLPEFLKTQLKHLNGLLGSHLPSWNLIFV